MNLSRRHFFRHSAAVSVGFLGLNRYLNASEHDPAEVYGPLRPDPHKIIDLPEGFRFRVLSRFGDKMDDKWTVPGQFDGMAAFPGTKGRIVLVRNHEIGHDHYLTGPFKDNTVLPEKFDVSRCYDPGDDKIKPFVGGTSNVVYDPKSGKVEAQFLSLFGTDRNCAGGPTPWGTWVTCEEPADLTSEAGLRHGYCFEVPPNEKPGLIDPVPLRGLGRFRHEAVAVRPETGVVYLTEDREDGLIYRFVPGKPGDLLSPGKLQALKVRDRESVDTRNWPVDESAFPIGKRLAVEWIDLEDIEGPNDDLRYRGVAAGAARFSRGEGMWYGSASQVGEEAVYWVCTDGGKIQQGQIFRYFPGTEEVELYLEPNDKRLLEKGDNICVAPWGDLIICEDASGTNAVRGVTPEGRFYTLVRNTMNDNEFAGACFSPDGEILFVNIQTPGMTLAITGPWKKTAVAG